MLKILFTVAIVLSVCTSGLLAHGQTRKGRKKTHKPATVATGSKVVAISSPVTTTPSGLIYVITRRSNGRQPKPGEKVVVNYTGLLGDGVKFDSSLDRGQPFSFKLGVGQVIKGWDEGIGKLKVGEQATLIIPSHLAYGTTGAGGTIPPDATLIFIVELMGIEDGPAVN
jgi:peptidylprolyl isomerase